MKSTAIVLVLAGACLAACASGNVKKQMGAVTPTEQFAIEVQSEPVTLQLAPHQVGASPRQVDALTALAGQWTDEGGGDITIQTPARDGDPAAAYRTASDARDILVANGVPPAKVRLASYGAGAGVPVIVVTYPRYKARGPECGRAWENLTSNGDNRPYNNFGCSLTANIAAQIANPADLLAPRASDPPDGGRRQVVLDKYRKGEVSSTAKDQQASGAVSNIVQ